MAMHSLGYRIFTFFLSMVVCVGFIGVGSIIAFWPATYIRGCAGQMCTGMRLG